MFGTHLQLVCQRRAVLGDLASAPPAAFLDAVFARFAVGCVKAVHLFVGSRWIPSRSPLDEGLGVVFHVRYSDAESFPCFMKVRLVVAVSLRKWGRSFPLPAASLAVASGRVGAAVNHKAVAQHVADAELQEREPQEIAPPVPSGTAWSIVLQSCGTLASPSAPLHRVSSTYPEPTHKSDPELSRRNTAIVPEPIERRRPDTQPPGCGSNS